mgnify:CR=1 FL=1
MVYEVWPVPPEVAPSAEARVRTPALENDDVAVPPKYAGPYEEKSVVEAWPSVVSPPVIVSVPAPVMLPLVCKVPAVVLRSPMPNPPVR